ncbi:hypothetical protein BCU68_13675 [Vibrio sp. 10N.286.49.B3]|uniref:phosphotransferase n=1 Tax=Vibrio sp. 10N.286.49.B3 TaxID=1880855 RepID=UPI000CB7DBD2|nr:phosphotransferase [Vibrio sp. 10N.286.49.B3]PMH42640.1 hypothetical protein BCU68_13675 [Vibrio sp. 10N.286.49.B3]
MSEVTNPIIARSIANVESIIELVNTSYDVTINNADLIQSRENDVYKLYGDTCSYLFKVYSLESMSFERLLHIEQVASSLYGHEYLRRSSSGSLSVSLNYPEGQRIGALYPWFKDVGSKSIDAQYANEFGKEIASLHLINSIAPSDISGINSKEIEDSIVNFSLSNGSKFLLLESLETLEKYPLSNLKSLDMGVCHGDCHLENTIWSESKVRLIDFDQLQYNYLASDLVSLAWSNHYNMGITDEHLNHLYFGYSSVKLLPNLDFEQFKYFLIKKEIEYLLSYFKRQQVIGVRFVGDNLVYNRIERLKQYKAPLGFFKYFNKTT